MNEFDATIDQIVEEWNKAERAIKHAENVNGEVVSPAISELRYAGRRIVEAMQLRKSSPEKAERFLQDALFDCHRARHDAIDAATTKMTGDLEAAVNFFTASVISNIFSNFSELYQTLLATREKIAESREHRDQRDAIYETIENTDLNRMIKLYDEFRTCEPLIAEEAKRIADETRRSKHKSRISLVVGAAGLLIGIIGLLRP